MHCKSIIFLFAILLFAMEAIAQVKPIKLKPDSSKILRIPEPSDVAVSEDRQSLYIVSDDGYLFQTDLNGNVLRKAEFTGYDFEGVYPKNGSVYVVEETMRRIIQYNAETLEKERVMLVPYAGGRNKSYESICYNQAKDCWVIITEREPVYIHEMDENFRLLNEIEFKPRIRDISACTWNDNHIWLLSDEDMLIMKCDPITYEILASYKIPVINPEGIAFRPDGTLLIISDDMERMYFFNTDKL